MKGTWLLMLFVVCALVALAGDAMACPYCAGNDDDGWGPTLLLGAMMIVPFAVVGVVWPIVTREAAREPTDPKTGEDKTCG